MHLADFKNKKVLIMGLGLHGGGVGAAAFFSRLESRVLVTDLKTRRELAHSITKLKRFKNITYHLGRHLAEDFKTADYIIKGPGVPDNSKFLKIASVRGIPILSDVEIFFRTSPAPIIGITGTKGKSTTTWLIGEFLKSDGRRVWVGGNIRTSVLEFLPRIKKGDYTVLELSSFQLDSLAQSRMSPSLAVITNIFPDHLNRYSSMCSYTASKRAIFQYQKRSDHLFINGDDAMLTRIVRGARSRVHRFTADKLLRRFRTSLDASIPPYHLANIAAAVAVAEHLGVGERAIRRVLKNFKGISGRMELVRTIRGVEFINDTAATNPGAAEAAVIATKQRIGRKSLHVIAGGYDKGLPVAGFARALRRSACSVIFLPGAASEKMRSGIKDQGSKRTNIYHAASMREAVQIARRNATQGDVVLLSPGAASFGLFQHEFDRGDKFVRAVKNLR